MSQRIGNSTFRSSGMHGEYFFTDEAPVRRRRRKIPLRSYDKGSTRRSQRVAAGGTFSCSPQRKQQEKLHSHAVRTVIPKPPSSDPPQQPRPRPRSPGSKPPPNAHNPTRQPYDSDSDSEVDMSVLQPAPLEKDFVKDKITRNPLGRMPLVQASRVVAPYHTTTVHNQPTDDILPEVQPFQNGLFPFIPRRHQWTVKRRPHHTDEASEDENLYSHDRHRLNTKRILPNATKNSTSSGNLTLKPDPNEEVASSVSTFKQVYKTPHHATGEHFMIMRELNALHGRPQ
eukprot:TRINITY_DN67992_c9_g5_i1.p1 TRINITY_DN67992_c9_g5~~TRINITY_DN67992_c9_g5_i1.p1  ORF type:complete len:285 (+),score=7.13 TRINITY_DN67992_c9_g5_i1:74-928(+)